MRVLMFGWEFPPHISGGLGTACFGLTRGLAANDVDITFIVPKAYGDEDSQIAHLVGANTVEVSGTEHVQREIKRIEAEEEKYIKEFKEERRIITTETGEEKILTYIKVDSPLLPYLSPEQFAEVMLKRSLDPDKVKVDYEGNLVYEEDAILTEKEVLERTEKHSKSYSNRIEFSGKYGPNLYQEVANYGVVAETIAQQTEFDIIHAHDWLTYAAGVAAKKATGKPLVVHIHATEFDRTGEHVNQRVYDIERMGMHAADLVIAVSHLTRQTVIDRYGIDPNKVVTVHNAVQPLEEEKKRYPKTVKEKIVTFLGRITYQKGPEYFVEAAHRVLQRDPNVRFVMAGSGDLMNKMVRYAAQLGIGTKFHFTGFLEGENVDRMFGMSDVYVMPSVSEPFGISPLEALRSNVPVIISKQSGVAEVLKHAIKVDFWDVDAIADAIYGLLNYEALPKMFREYGKAEVDSLKWEKVAEEVKRKYQELHDKYYS